MHSFRRLLSFSPSHLRLPPPFSSSFSPTCLSREVAVLGRRPLSTRPPSSSAATGDDDWNDAWETAWLPEDPSAKDRAPWEPDPISPSAAAASLPSDIDAETKAFVAEMDERWSERRAAKKLQQGGSAFERVEKNSKKAGDDYRVRKQRIHAGLWMKEIEKMEEAKVGGSNPNDDIDRLLDSCSEIFDAGNMDLNDSKIPSTSEFKTKPDGWETTSRSQDGSIWEISQREEDILLQEFERRIAFCKFQIASFIKTHIFSRRRPVDGWKYMIEVIGPNARRGKGSVQRLPSLTDPSTQPYKEEKPAIGRNLTSFGGR
ncbi:protein GAMETE CELL DEFECTIVE 1, mitochondrial [Phoenix dactylifera]|uniref:Protein GAMETE CELL DEFECTIVE 1, mitochondrial n=1 Tax=Phoenix dactylifera TaxID=42345 RepID=A0A8B7CNU1_PHODC|nr:protein GAMETE CELL DEFECTIVE 1, mitochondrial [Phoenix dactylifera]